MNIMSLGPETVDEYWSRGLIHNVADLYDLTVIQITGGNKNRRLSAENVIKGITSGKLLARHFKTIDSLINATLDDLLEIDGIGEVMAKSILSYFHNEENLKMVERLRHSRDEYKTLIEQHGGKNVGSISGKTSFILAGDNMGPSKLQKAEKLGVPIVNEDEFLEMIK